MLNKIKVFIGTLLLFFGGRHFWSYLLKNKHSVVTILSISKIAYNKNIK